MTSERHARNVKLLNFFLSAQTHPQLVPPLNCMYIVHTKNESLRWLEMSGRQTELCHAQHQIAQMYSSIRPTPCSVHWTLARSRFGGNPFSHDVDKHLMQAVACACDICMAKQQNEQRP